MKHKLLKTALLLSVAAGFGSTGAFAFGSSSHMSVEGRTSQPIGHYEYCAKYSSDCRIKTRDTRAPKLTRKRWEELVSVNAYSNNTIRPVTDYEAYNVEELWSYPTTYGDCEDYVLMKRHMLMQRGWPASSLLITVVRQPNGEGHAVLTVRTDKADYVLDNLENQIKPWNETPYRFLKRQASHHSGHWMTIKDHRS